MRTLPRRGRKRKNHRVVLKELDAVSQPSIADAKRRGGARKRSEKSCRSRVFRGADFAPTRTKTENHRVVLKSDKRRFRICGASSACRKVFSTSCLRFQNFLKVLKSVDLNGAGHPSWVHLRAKCRRFASVALRNGLRASRAHPSFPFSYSSGVIDSLTAAGNSGGGLLCPLLLCPLLLPSSIMPSSMPASAAPSRIPG